MQGIPFILTWSDWCCIEKKRTFFIKHEFQGSQLLVAIWNYVTFSMNKTTPIHKICSSKFLIGNVFTIETMLIRDVDNGAWEVLMAQILLLCL